jgi:hypothetical protein
MDRIIQLEEIAVSLEEAKQLNNSVPSALAWAFNKWKNTQEFEIISVERLAKELSTEETPKLNLTITEHKGEWKLYESQVFVGMDQIKFMIEKGEFYYAPLKVVSSK